MSDCLSDADLDRYNANEMDTDEATRAAEHIKRCERCVRRNAERQAGHEQLLTQVRGLDLDEPAQGEATISVDPNRDDVTEPDSGSAMSNGLAGRLRKIQELPDRIGAFKVLELLGEGGMGVVYLAEQTDPIRRRVALKLIKLGMDTKQVIARFESERQALALMDHPNIAKVFEAGATSDGRPYFVMEHVKGVPITEHCDRQRMDTKERLALFAEVCQAVQHAHQRGVIHRDIKPSNILVSVHDGTPVPKIIDFGVAKATQQHLTEKTLFTEQGQLIGTPEYMSPEQAEMTAQDIDTRTDVYSLGVVLYELLAGALPFEPKSLRRAGFAEIQRIIREEDPPKPSTRLSSLGDESGTVAKKHRADPGSLVRELRGDLDWITMRALEKDRTRRYASASDLAEDVLRHLRHEPVVASPPSVLYRFRKYLRRNRSRVAAAIVVLGLATAAVGFAQYKKQRDVRERRKQRAAQSERDVLEGITKQQQGDTLGAYGSFATAHLLDPTEFAAIANQARLKQEKFFAVSPGSAPLSLLHESEKLCDQALALQPKHAQLWNVKCVTLYALGKLGDAETTCREAIRIDPDNCLPPTNLAIVLSLQGRIDEALAAAIRSVQTAERLGEAAQEWAAGPWQTLATLQLHFGKPEARQSLEKAFACIRNDEWGYMLRARLRMSLSGYKDLKQALEDATTANALAPVPDPRIKRTLALASLRNGQYADAVKYARQALDLGGFLAADHLILSIAYANLNDPSAGEHFKAALAVWPIEMERKDGFLVTADRGGLWIDTAEELQGLRAKAAALINRSP